MWVCVGVFVLVGEFGEFGEFGVSVCGCVFVSGWIWCEGVWVFIRKIPLVPNQVLTQKLKHFWPVQAKKKHWGHKLTFMRKLDFGGKSHKNLDLLVLLLSTMRMTQAHYDKKLGLLFDEFKIWLLDKLGWLLAFAHLAWQLIIFTSGLCYLLLPRLI